MGLFGNSKKAEQTGEIDNIITLKDDSGKEYIYEFLDLIKYDNRAFVVLLPRYDDNGEVTILEIEGVRNGEENYITVDSDDEIDILYALFKNKFKDEFDFGDK